MEPIAVDSIRTTDPMVILRAQGIPARDLVIRAAAYDTVHQRKILPTQELKAAEMETRKRIMVWMTNRDGEEEGIRINPDYPSGIYATASVEDQCRLIAKNLKRRRRSRTQR